jgi:hypothetical protein
MPSSSLSPMQVRQQLPRALAKTELPTFIVGWVVSQLVSQHVTN